MTRSSKYRFGLLASALIVAPGIAGAAQAADAGWVATRTQAFLPAPTPGASAAAGTRASALLQASRNAPELPATERRHLVLALTTPSVPTDAQLHSVIDYLQRSGFTGVHASASRRLVEADGTAAAIKSAFRTTLRSFAYQGRQVFANDAPAQVPAALGGIVGAVLGLQNVSQAHTFIEQAAPSQLLAQARTNAVLPTVKKPHRISDFISLYNADAVNPRPIISVSVVLSGDLSKAIANVKSYLGGSLPTPEIKISRTDQGSYQDDPQNDIAATAILETLLEVAGDVTTLKIFDASDLSEANLASAYDSAFADATSVEAGPIGEILIPSGMPEEDAHSSGFLDSFDYMYTNTFHVDPPDYVVASGDSGAYAASQGIVQDAQGHWLVDPADYSVMFPASSPHVTSIGGTSLYVNANSPTAYHAYGWETVWNSGLQPVDAAKADSALQLHAGGGGISRYEQVGSYGQPLPDHSERIVPDFSMDADPASGAYAELPGVLPYTANPVVGGTGLAAAIYMGLQLRLDGAGAWGDRMKSVVSTLEDNNKYWNTAYTREQLLHSVKYGNNGYGGYGYQAVTGYDAASGWGSISAGWFLLVP